MSLRHPSRTTRRLLQIASLGLAGLLAGLLTGCTSTSPKLLESHNDTDWQTSSTYASATAGLGPRTTPRSAHGRSCVSGACEPHASVSHPPAVHHHI